MTRNERRRRRAEAAVWIFCTVAIIALALAVSGAVAEISATGEEETYTPETAGAAEGLKTAFVEADKKAAEEIDVDKLVMDALLARCEKVEDCWIVGYAPELVDGWREEYRNERGLYLTASGAWCAPGYTVATDPEVIPTGATVIIEGRIYTAADRGVNGKVIDVMVTPEEALVYGARIADVYWMMGEGKEEE